MNCSFLDENMYASLRMAELFEISDVTVPTEEPETEDRIPVEMQRTESYNDVVSR